AIGVESVKMATSFQASMEKVHTQAGASQKSVENLSKSVLKLGNYAQQSPQELADALFHLKSVGLDDAAAMKALKTATDLAAVGGANLEDTTNALAGAWRSGIKGASSFGQTAATVNAIIGAGNMQMTDLIGAFGTGILPAARTFGVSLKSVGSALALMTDEGVPAEMAATRLKMSLSLLAAPSAVAEKQLGTIGLTGLKLANTMRGPGGLVAAIALLKQHLDASGLSASKQAILLSHAFGGGRSSSAILTMVNNLGVLEKKQAQINNTTSKYGSDVAAQRKTASAQFALLKSSVETIGVRIGLALLPPVTRFAQYLSKTVVPDAGNAASAIGRLIPVAAIERDVSTVERALGGLFGAQQKTKTPRLGPKGNAVDLTLRPKIASTPDLGKTLGTLPAKLVSGVLTAVGKINWGSLASKMAPAALSFVVDFAAALLDPATWLKVIKSSWPALLTLVLTAITLPIGGEGGTIFKVLADLVEHVPILKLVTPLLRAVDRLFAPLNKGFQKLLGKAFGWVGHFGGDLLGKLLTGLDSTFPRITRWLVGGLALFEGLLKRFPKATLAAGIMIIRGLWSGMKAAWSSVTGWLGGLDNRIHGYFTRATSWLLNAGGNVVLGLLHGIKAKMAGIGSWIRGNIVNPVINWVKSLFGIHSPSTVFHGFGVNMIAGLLRGLATTSPRAIVDKIFGSVPKALGALVTKGIVGVGSLGGKALSALGGLGGKILGFLGLGAGGGTSSGSNVALGKVMAAAMGWTGAQFNALNKLWTQESGWNSRAKNPSSGAYGIPQALPASKMGSAGADWLTNAATQIKWGLGYIAQRYGSPLAAWAHETAYNWYAGGTAGAKRGWAWVGERGPELVKFGGGEHVLDAVTSRKLAAGALNGYASGTSLAKLGRELLRSRHSGVLDTEVANTKHRYSSEHLLATAPGLGPARHRHYAKLAAGDKKHLASLEHTLAAERAYRAQLNARVSVLKATEAAAKKEHLPGVAATSAKRIKAHQAIIANINRWTAGKASFAKAAGTAAKTTTTAASAPAGNMDIADWAAYISSMQGGAAYKSGSWYVPATGPATVHQGEMIFPKDVADAIRSGGLGGGDTRVYVDLDGQAIEPRMVKV
ncbi:MAG: phage tail tape measure protein, partial [Streptosporangiaceae bacterium]